MHLDNSSFKCLDLLFVITSTFMAPNLVLVHTHVSTESMMTVQQSELKLGPPPKENPIWKYMPPSRHSFNGEQTSLQSYLLYCTLQCLQNYWKTDVHYRDKVRNQIYSASSRPSCRISCSLFLSMAEVPFFLNLVNLLLPTPAGSVLKLENDFLS